MRRALPLSFRTRILFIVLVLGTVPMALLGLWLAGSTARAGEELVRARVDAELEETAEALVSRWIGLRSRILDLADDPRLGDALSGQGDLAWEPEETVERLGFRPVGLRVRDREGGVLWRTPVETSGTADGRIIPRPGLVLDVPVYARESGATLGTLEVEIPSSTLLPPEDMPEALLVGLFDSRTGTSLVPRGFDRPLASESRFVWGSEEWLASRVSLDDPPLTVALAASSSPFEELFDRKARTGLRLLLAVSAVGLALTVVATARLTGSLRRLAVAAEAVAGGDLERRADVGGPREVGQVGRAFNRMTESLRGTLRELSRRESLAAVGEFAASLAHEVRNPLTAIRVDLERVEEGLSGDSPLRRPQERALREIVRLDETVSQALRTARGGRVEPGVVDLGDPLRAAAEAVRPELEPRGASLEMALPASPTLVRGDAGALEQLLLNLLRNAAQAVEPGGRVSARVEASEGRVEVEIRDDGGGMAPDVLARVFEPLFSTREEGTGLGLTIARRIAEAHGARLELESIEARGTTARLTLPSAAVGKA